jgi:hypothetical protein
MPFVTPGGARQTRMAAPVHGEDVQSIASVRLAVMASREELDRLSGEQLHDLAVRRALKHLDVRFFWRLLETLPAAEAAAGELDKANADVQSTLAHLDDLTDSGRGETAELLRPLYIDYLADD